MAVLATISCMVCIRSGLHKKSLETRATTRLLVEIQSTAPKYYWEEMVMISCTVETILLILIVLNNSTVTTMKNGELKVSAI